jgi:hypothetical protein
MSMSWIWCLNHNLQHEKPGESPTPTPGSRLPDPEIWLWMWNPEPSISICQVGVAHLVTVEGAETQYICMNSIGYKYEVCGVWGASIITYNMLQLQV